MKEIPEIQGLTRIEWLIIVIVLLGIVVYAAYPGVYKIVQAYVSQNLQQELTKTRDELERTKKELPGSMDEDKIEHPENTIKTQQPDTKAYPESELQKRVSEWEDYARKASAYQDYLEGKEGSQKIERPVFPYTLL